MKTLIKLLIVASLLLSFNTSHAFWGDDGDDYVSVTAFAGEGATTNFETQLKNIKSGEYKNGKYWVYQTNPPEWNFGSIIGWISSSKDIEKVKKYLKK
tara:strand:- start:182 stop:475 length:294 start_codon:yes stop_codon:yes gene_type:complete